VQFDNRFSDLTYDAVWNSMVKISSKGWTAEIQIPYSAIRFPAAPVQEWGLQCTRTIRRIREFDQWAIVPLTASNAQLHWGLLKGIENIHSPLRLSFTPYLATTMQRQPGTDSEGKTIYDNSFSYSAGADIKYGIDDRFTLDMILLPDFGQVQSDNKVKNLSYNEVVFDENRPFFKEGVELFGKGEMFYSRRIGKTPFRYQAVYDSLKEGEVLEKNPPQVKLLNAFKISGRTDKGLGIGLFNAITNNTYAEIKTPDGETRKLLTEPLTDYNIIVLDQQLKHNSNFYFINTHTNRDKGFDDANVTGTGFLFSNRKNTFVVGGDAALSQRLSQAESRNSFINTIGYKYALGIGKQGGNVQYGIEREEVNNEFNTSDLGYFIIPGYISYEAYLNAQQYNPWHGIRESFHNVNADVKTNFTTGDLRFTEFRFNSFANLMSYNAFFVGAGISPFDAYDYRESREDGRKFRMLKYYFYFAGISTDYRKRVAVDITLTRADLLNEQTTQPFYEGNISFRLRLNDHLFIKTFSEYSLDEGNLGFAYLVEESGRAIFGLRRLETYENRIGINYIFKNDMLLTVTGRHYWNTGDYKRFYSLLDDGEVFPLSYLDDAHDFSSNFFNVDVVYEWRFAPGSFINLIYKNAIENETALNVRRFNRNFEDVLNAPQTNTFSIKLLYYLDYLTLKRKKVQ
jgi:hypothetical protein